MLSLFLAVAFAFSPADADRAFVLADRFVKDCTPRDAGTIRGRIASNFLLDEASKIGADVCRDVFMADTPKGLRQFTNLSCEFASNVTSKWVVLVSHYDTKPGVNCPGANDGATSSALLVSLAAALQGWKAPRGNVMLLWTDGEECMEQYADNDGFWGSKRAAAALKASGRPVRAVICLDMIADADLHVSIPSNGSKPLSKIAVLAASRAGYPGLVSHMAEAVKDDHVAFLDNGFAAIDLIDFEYGRGNAYWHTPDDTMEHVSRESLLKTGRLVAELLNILL